MENGEVNGIKRDSEIKEHEGSDRPFSHIKEKIILNFKEDTISGMIFSISCKLVIKPALSMWD